MKVLFKILFALFIVLAYSCSTSEESPENESEELIIESFVPETKVIEIEILELLNQHREEINLNRLDNLSKIKAEAYTHSMYMISNNSLSHDNFSVRMNNLVNNSGAIAIAENVASGFNSTLELIEAWLESEGHKNVIEGDYTHFDISAEQDEDGKWYYTNIFIKK